MRKKSLIDDYLKNYSVGDKWQLITNDADNISQVVVIPAYAEKEMLFSTLDSIAKNLPSSLEYSLVLCVINNKENSPSEDKKNNRWTIECLDALIKRKSLRQFSGEQKVYPLLNNIAESKVKVSYIDAASEGYALPARAGGVGLARKIGMDMALRLLECNSSENPLIICLDADTLVKNDYLFVIRKYFTSEVKTAVMAYAHQMPANYEHKAAIVCYEIFLRYWVLGLRYAESPWSFHSVGSTIAVSAETYAEVRGMNRREAGEDFYFLNKLAKIGAINYIKETCVYPSARLSMRVPFGTGKSIQKFLSKIDREEFYRLYDVRIFEVLRNWLKLMKEHLMDDENEILTKAGEIHAFLKSFLIINNFASTWSKIRRNSKDEEIRARQFNDWFDGFKTLKLIKYFTAEVYPKTGMFEALDAIIAMSGIKRFNKKMVRDIPNLEDQIEILEFLRLIT